MSSIFARRLRDLPLRSCLNLSRSLPGASKKRFYAEPTSTEPAAPSPSLSSSLPFLAESSTSSSAGSGSSFTRVVTVTKNHDSSPRPQGKRTPNAGSVARLSELPRIKPNEPYFVQRTPTNGLPVYNFAKSGGNLKLTRVRKLSGDTEVLRCQLEDFLTPKPEYVKLNPLTQHIIIKGSYAHKVEAFLARKGF